MINNVYYIILALYLFEDMKFIYLKQVKQQLLLFCSV